MVPAPQMSRHGFLAVFLILLCVGMAVGNSVLAAWPLGDEERALLGTYVAEEKIDGDIRQCRIYLLDEPVTEIEGVWYVARPRLDEPNLKTCDALGIGFPVAWSPLSGDEFWLLATSEKPGARSFNTFGRDGADSQLFSLRDSQTGIATVPALILRHGSNEVD